MSIPRDIYWPPLIEEKLAALSRPLKKELTDTLCCRLLRKCSEGMVNGTLALDLATADDGLPMYAHVWVAFTFDDARLVITNVGFMTMTPA